MTAVRASAGVTDLLDLAEPATGPRRKPRHPEWSLQTKVKQFAREAVACPHKFAAHDRSRNYEGKQHLWESVRGVVAGWPDTELAWTEGRTFRCELKARDNKPSDKQNEIGAELIALGHPWAWADTVTGYYQAAMAAGVPFRPHAAALAAHYDALLAEGAAPRAKKKRGGPGVAPRKPTSAQIRRAEAVRSRIRF